MGSKAGARWEREISEGTDGQVAKFGFYSRCNEGLLKLPASGGRMRGAVQQALPGKVFME